MQPGYPDVRLEYIRGRLNFETAEKHLLKDHDAAWDLIYGGAENIFAKSWALDAGMLLPLNARLTVSDEIELCQTPYLGARK